MAATRWAWPVVDVECPECKEAIPVPIEVEIVGAPGEQRMTCDPDLTDLWAHAWAHLNGEEK